LEIIWLKCNQFFFYSHWLFPYAFCSQGGRPPYANGNTQNWEYFEQCKNKSGNKRNISRMKGLDNTTIDQQGFVRSALAVPAHPLWARICWRFIDDSDVLDREEIARRGIDGDSLWHTGDVNAFTYGQWFALLEYAFEKIGPLTGVHLAVIAKRWSPPFTEVIRNTAPDLRSFFHFWEFNGLELDISHTFKSTPVRGGMRYDLDYAMSGKIEQAFAWSCIAIVANVINVVLGRETVTAFRVNMEVRQMVMDYGSAQVGVRMERGELSDPTISFVLADEDLDNPSVGGDNTRFTLAIAEFNQLCHTMREAQPDVTLRDRVISHQITNIKPLSLEQMAEKVSMRAENYRKKLRECGTSHRQIVKDCVTYNAEKMVTLGMSQSEISDRMGLSPARLRRYMSESPVNS
jgi:hypothetical protein